MLFASARPMRRPPSHVRALLLTAATGLAVVGALGACGGGGTTATSTNGTEPPPAATALADEVEIDHVSVNQAVQVTVFDDAAPKTPNAPIIAGRPGLVRIHARTIDKKVKRPAPLTGTLRVKVPGKGDLVPEAIVRKLAPIDPSDLASTFSFELPPEAFAAGTKLAFSLTDAAMPGDPGVTLPFEDGALALDVKDTATTLKVQIVPVRYGADGSKRTPDLSDAALSFYRESLYKMYPVAKVDMSVRDAIDWPLAVNPDGDGWDGLLEQIIRLRRTDVVADDVYYAAVFTPAASASQYCKQGCVLGVAPAQLRSEVGLRVAMIAGFGSRSEGGTLAQEIAHAMGRLHAPCGRPGDLDDEYPYDSGRIGVWGWDPLTKELLDPEERVFDFMSYCQPVWVSDYTFQGLWQAADAVARTKRPDPAVTPPADVGGSGSGTPSGGATTTLASLVPSAAIRLVTKQLGSLVVGTHGEITRGEPVDAVEEAERSTDTFGAVTFEDARGRAVGTAPARWRPTGGLRSGRLILPEGVTVPTGAVRVRTADLGRVSLRAARFPR